MTHFSVAPFLSVCEFHLGYLIFAHQAPLPGRCFLVRKFCSQNTKCPRFTFHGSSLPLPLTHTGHHDLCGMCVRCDAHALLESGLLGLWRNWCVFCGLCVHLVFFPRVDLFIVLLSNPIPPEPCWTSSTVHIQAAVSCRLQLAEVVYH